MICMRRYDEIVAKGSELDRMDQPPLDSPTGGNNFTPPPHFAPQFMTLSPDYQHVGYTTPTLLRPETPYCIHPEYATHFSLQGPNVALTQQQQQQHHSTVTGIGTIPSQTLDNSPFNSLGRLQKATIELSEALEASSSLVNSIPSLQPALASARTVALTLCEVSKDLIRQAKSAALTASVDGQVGDLHTRLHRTDKFREILHGLRFHLLQEIYRMSVMHSRVERWDIRQREALITVNSKIPLPTVPMSCLASPKGITPHSTPEGLARASDAVSFPAFRRKYEWTLRKWTENEKARATAAVARRADAELTLFMAERLSLNCDALSKLLSGSSMTKPELFTGMQDTNEIWAFAVQQANGLPSVVLPEKPLGNCVPEITLDSLPDAMVEDRRALQHLATSTLASQAGTLPTRKIPVEFADNRLELLDIELQLKLERLQTPDLSRVLYCKFVPNDAFEPPHKDIADPPTSSQECYWENFWNGVVQMMAGNADITGRDVRIHWIHHLSSRVDREPFTKELDDELLDLLISSECGVGKMQVTVVNRRGQQIGCLRPDWRLVARKLGRTEFQCFERYARALVQRDPAPWTPEEDEKLLGLVSSGEYGTAGSSSYWVRIALAMGGGKDNSQCRTRHMTLSRTMKRSEFKPEDDIVVQVATATYGIRNWQKAARHLQPQRTGPAVRERFEALFPEQI